MADTIALMLSTLRQALESNDRLPREAAEAQKFVSVQALRELLGIGRKRYRPKMLKITLPTPSQNKAVNTSIPRQTYALVHPG